MKNLKRFFYLAALALVFGWVILWHLSVNQVENTLARWKEAESGDGSRFSYDASDRGGFPFTARVTLTNVVWRTPTGIDARTPDVAISILPWNWLRFHIHTNQPATIVFPVPGESNFLRLGTLQAEGTIRIGINGDPRQINLDFIQAGVGPFSQTPADWLRAERLMLALSFPDDPPQKYDDTALTLSLAGENLHLPENTPVPMGPLVQTFTTTLRMMGKLPESVSRISFDTWRRDGGACEIEDISLLWGPLALRAKGAVALDRNLQPEAALAAEMTGYNDAIDAAIAKGDMQKLQGSLLKAALGMLAKPSGIDGKPMIQAPLSIQDRVLSVGPLPIFRLPDIDWPGVPPALPSPVIPALPR